MRSVVVLPQPEGPSRHANSPCGTWKESPRNAVSRTPSADRKDFSLMSTLSVPPAPTGRMSFKGLHHQKLDQEHDGHEGQRIGEDRRYVEELETEIDLETDSVGAAKQLDDKHDLPDQRNAGSRRCRQIGLQLRQQDMAQPVEHTEAVDGGHFRITPVQRARPFAHRDDDVRTLVD